MTTHLSCEQEAEEKLGCVVEEREELSSHLCSIKEHHVSLQQETKLMEQELEATKTELRTRWGRERGHGPPMRGGGVLCGVKWVGCVYVRTYVCM